MVKSSLLYWGLLLGTSSATSLGSSLIKRQDVVVTGGDICRFWDHRSVLIDNWIYVDFGFATWVTSVKQGWMTRIEPFGLDLSKPFVTANLGSESESFLTVNITTEVPPTTKGAIWVDKDNTIYKYGGVYPSKSFWGSNSSYLDVRPSAIWALETKTFTWSKLPQQAGDTVDGARNGGGAYVPELGLGFFAGGHLSNQTDSKFSGWVNGELEILNTMATFNMQNNTWKNASSPLDPFTLSSLVYVPVGKQGILVSLGGMTTTTGMFNSTTDELLPRAMDSIIIYDIERQTWVTQRATGAIPRDRYSFCAVAAVSEDKSSYSIILHGGHSFNDVEAFGDTYVLSMPSFQFVKVNDGTTGGGRTDHTCHLAKNKLIVVGGRGTDQPNPGVTGQANGDCDPTGLINILDVNTFEWDTSYDPKAGADYQVQEAISNVIGGDERGCATSLSPEAGWGSARLRELFGTFTPASDCASRQPTKTSRSSSSTASSTSTATGEPNISSMNRVENSVLYLGLLSLAIVIPFL